MSWANLVILCQVFADNLNIDGRGKTEIQDLADDVRGLKKEFNAGKLPWQSSRSCFTYSAVG